MYKDNQPSNISQTTIKRDFKLIIPTTPEMEISQVIQLEKFQF